jgi:hypothetical protein
VKPVLHYALKRGIEGRKVRGDAGIRPAAGLLCGAGEELEVGGGPDMRARPVSGIKEIGRENGPVREDGPKGKMAGWEELSRWAERGRKGLGFGFLFSFFKNLFF